MAKRGNTKRYIKLLCLSVIFSVLLFTYPLNAFSQEGVVVKGIVQENNPVLGYITVYFEDGTGTGPENEEKLTLLRTYNYRDGEEIEVLRNHAPAKIDDIEEGDTVYILLNDEGFISKISSADNYEARYGRILSKGYNSLIIEYSDGSNEIFRASSETLLVKDGIIASLTDLQEGDSVKLLVNVTERGETLKAVFCSHIPRRVTGLYKGVLSRVDNLRSTIYVFNVQEFRGGRWMQTAFKGISGIRMSPECRIYSGNNIITPDEARYLANSVVYIASTEGLSSGEVAEIVQITANNERETIFKDEVYSVSRGSNTFRLLGQNSDFDFGNSIFVKDGRLIGNGSLQAGLDAYVIASRRFLSGAYTARIVIAETEVDGPVIYRVRIDDITDGLSFTLESYSILGSQDWQFHNTPLTFSINYETRLVGADGVKNMRDFTGYGENSSVGKTFYIVADGLNALLISEAPFGSYFTRCEVYDVQGNIIKGDKVLNFNDSTHMWVDTGDMEFNLLNDTIIIKNGKVIRPEEINKGDFLELVRKDGNSGDVYIVKVLK